MALEFQVYKHVPAGSSNVKKINEGSIDAKGLVMLNEPRGHIWFGGDQDAQVQVALDGFAKARSALVQYVTASLSVPLVIGGQPLPNKSAYSIDLTFKPK